MTRLSEGKTSVFHVWRGLVQKCKPSANLKTSEIPVTMRVSAKVHDFYMFLQGEQKKNVITLVINVLIENLLFLMLI